jgi:metal transporter CNNM
LSPRDWVVWLAWNKKMLTDEDVQELQALVGDGGRRELLEILLQHDFSSKEEEVIFYWRNVVGTIFAIALVATCSGLFLGLMTLDSFDLKIIMRSSMDDDEKRYAAALYPIVKQRHLLLVTLLICDATAYEILPLFLDKLMPVWAVLLLSTTLVLLFGEILPSAICMGPQQLQLGYYMVPPFKVLMFILYPVAKPCSMLLDYIVHGPDGEDATQEEYNRGELSALVKIQYEERNTETSHTRTRITEKKFPIRTLTHWSALKKEMLDAVNGRSSNKNNDDDDFDDEGLERELNAPMEKQEVDVVVGALQMKTKVATDVYTPRRHVYAIPDDLVLDKEGMTAIYAKGYSRVPVYRNKKGRDKDINQSCVIGFLMTRQLMMIDWDHEREVKTLPMVRPDCVSPRENLVDLLNLLRSGGSLMAFVCARKDLANRALLADKPLPVDAGFMGIITLEDILESILQTRIYDENDVRDRDRAVATLKKWAALKLQSFARKSVAKRRGSASLSPTRAKRPKATVLVQDMLSEKTPLIKKKIVLGGSRRRRNSRHGDDDIV